MRCLGTSGKSHTPSHFPTELVISFLLEGERKTRKRIVWQGKAERLQEWTQSLQMLAEETKMAGPLS